MGSDAILSLEGPADDQPAFPTVIPDIRSGKPGHVGLFLKHPWKEEPTSVCLCSQGLVGTTWLSPPSPARRCC